jgi:hypothetical protein
MKIHLNNIIIIGQKINILVINNFGIIIMNFLFLKYIYLHFEIEKKIKNNNKIKFLNPSRSAGQTGPTEAH